MDSEPCSWCGEPVAPEEGYRLAEEAGERRAVFCRLEHVVPWAIQGAHWTAGEIDLPEDRDPLERCTECDAQLDDACIVLVRHRGDDRVMDAFCGVPHLIGWARAGGRYR